MTTIGELFDEEGPWTEGLIELMYSVALEMQADSTQMSFETLRAAIGSLLSKDVAKQFRAGLDQVRRAAQGKTGRQDQEPEEDTADMLIRALGSLGLNIPKKAKG